MDTPPPARSRIHPQLLVREAVPIDLHFIWRAHGRILLAERVGDITLPPRISAIRRPHTHAGPDDGGIGYSGKYFQPRKIGAASTLETDVFLWGCVVYTLMTGYWPGEGQGLEHEEKDTLPFRQEWPRLEAKYLGEVVRKCWTGKITSAVGISSAVRTTVTDMGVVVGDDGATVDLAIDGLTMRPSS